MRILVILLIWFHSALASICNVNTAGTSPNHTIKFYNGIYMASSWSMSESDVLYWNPQNGVTCRIPMQTNQQNQRRFGTTRTSTAGSTADWLLTHKPNIKNVFFSILTVHINKKIAKRTTAMFIAKFQPNCTMAKKLWINYAERLWHFSFG